MMKNAKTLAIGLQSVFLVLATLATGACGPTARRPNIIVLFPDQMRGQALGVAGHPDVKTPHMDRLASEGIYLPNTFANTPVCCPARGTMLTGKYPHQHGVIINDLRLRESQVTIAEALSAAGYQTGFIGKWHLDGGIRMPGFIPPGPRRQGFAWWAANECSHRHFETWYFRDDPKKIPINTFESNAWTDLSIEFIREYQDRPFFLMVGMGPPHNPYKAPEKYRQMVDSAKLTMRANWKEKTKLGSREDLAHYYSMIANIDDNVGRLMAILDELGLTADTLILLTSDHGDMLGSQGTMLKRKPWEESIRVPGIIRYPRKIKAGQVKDTILTHVDFVPTLLSFAGVAAPAGVQGTDLSKVLTGDSQDEPEAAFLSIYMHYGEKSQGKAILPWRGVRTKRYTYARFEDDPWVLYDNQADPYQLKNLVDKPEHRELQAELDDMVLALMEKHQDSWAHNVAKETILHNAPAVYSVEEFLENQKSR